MARLADSEFLRLLAAHRHELFRYALRNLWNPSAAEDVFAAAVLTAYEQLDHFQEGTNFRAWLYRIITNKCYVANRETQRSAIGLDELDESHFAADPDDDAAALADPEKFLDQCGDELHRALAQLNTGERSCLLLLAAEKYTYQELAAVLEMPVGTVMTHLARGRAKLRRLLLDYARARGIVKRLAPPAGGAANREASG